MKATDIAFVQLVGIKQNENHLSLENKKDIHNHIDTIHACAQVTLAETQSGMHLQQLFPELEGLVVPLLRDSSMKYKKPATSKLTAYSFVDEASVQKFKTQFAKKGRGSLSVEVELKDIDGLCVAQGVFGWFISKI